MFYLPSPALGTEDTIVNRTYSAPTDKNIQSFDEETNTKERNKNKIGQLTKVMKKINDVILKNNLG